MKTTLTRLAVLVVAFGFFSVVKTANGGLLARWKLDGNANDSIGNNHGTVTGSVAWSTGCVDKAVQFNGGGHVNCYNDSIFNLTDSITVACWVKVQAFDKDWQVVVSKGNSSGWRIQRSDAFHDANALSFHCSGVEGVDGSVNVNDGNWHHVAGVYDGEKLYLYVDGKLDVSRTATGKISVGDYNLYIGENSEWPQCGFNGLIDDVCIFDNPLSSEEIAKLYKEGTLLNSDPTLLMLTNAIGESEALIEKAAYKEAIAFLEKVLAEFEKWKEQTANAESLLAGHKMAYDLHYALARAKEATGASVDRTIALYRNQESLPARGAAFAASLVWLSRHMSLDEYKDVVRKYAHDGSWFTEGLADVVKAFRSNGQWEAFETFLKAVYSQDDVAAPPLDFISDLLRDNPEWDEGFLDFCMALPGQKQYAVSEYRRRAEENVKREDFSNAIRMTTRLRDCGNSDKDKALAELQICKYMFQDGDYEQAIITIDDLLDKDSLGDSPQDLAEAILLKGRFHLALRELDKALEAFSQLPTKYPDSQLCGEAHLLSAYCLMLQGKANQAISAFDAVAKSCPEGNIRRKALICIEKAKQELISSYSPSDNEIRL